MQRRYCYILNENTVRILRKHSIQFEDGNIIALNDDAGYWESISMDFQSNNIKFIRVELEFTEDELNNSDWLRMRSSWHWEYPQPENTFKEFTYGKGNFCEKCGAKFSQVRPFKLKKAPSWQKKNFLQLNWVDDEIFVKRETYDLLLESGFKGLDYFPVVRGRENNIIDNIVQLKTENLLEPGLMNEEAVEHNCEVCHAKKFYLRGENKTIYSKESFGNGESDIYKSNERFGSPDLHIAARQIIVSNRFYKFMCDMRLDFQLEFQPVDCV